MRFKVGDLVYRAYADPRHCRIFQVVEREEGIDEDRAWITLRVVMDYTTPGIDSTYAQLGEIASKTQGGLLLHCPIMLFLARVAGGEPYQLTPGLEVLSGT